MTDPTNKTKKLADGLENLIMNFKAVDDTCLSLTENLTSRELQLISFVGSSQRVIMRQIADMLDVPMSTATGIVDKLVNRNFLQRSHSKEDRRTVNIELDEEGQSVFDLYQRLKEQMTGQVLSILSSEESEHFMDLLEKITLGLVRYLKAQEV